MTKKYCCFGALVLAFSMGAQSAWACHERASANRLLLGIQVGYTFGSRGGVTLGADLRSYTEDPCVTNGLRKEKPLWWPGWSINFSHVLKAQISRVSIEGHMVRTTLARSTWSGLGGGLLVFRETGRIRLGGIVRVFSTGLNILPVAGPYYTHAFLPGPDQDELGVFGAVFEIVNGRFSEAVSSPWE